MSINLVKYKEPLLAAWRDVVDDKTPTDWALFGYEGQTNDLKVVSKGNGGIEELVEDLNSGKIMYAFCRVNDPKTSLPKCVLINWQGEGAPIVRKGTCANHIRDVGTFFKGAHVTLHARNEEEVDPQIIIDKVAKSGSAYSFNERVESEHGSGPVGTTYKKVVPRQEINSKERDKFWEKEEQEEKQRQVEERLRRNAESTKLDDERKTRELGEAAVREEKIQVRSKNVFQQREAEKLANVVKVEELTVEQNNGDAERMGRSDVLRRQRSQEAQSVISKRNFDARAVFEQNTSAGQLHQLRRSSVNQPPTAATNPPASSINDSQPLSPSRKASLPSWPPADDSANTVISKPNGSDIGTSNGYVQNNASYSPNSSSGNSYPTDNGISSPTHASVSESTRFSPNPSVGVSSPTQPVAEVVSASAQEKKVLFQEPDDAQYEEVEYVQNKAPQDQVQGETEQEWATGIEEEGLDYNGQDMGDPGLQARALYDYQAADATELTFDPGDIISHIDQIDEGWWQGLGPDGTFGLFPANYVELIQ